MNNVLNCIPINISNDNFVVGIIIGWLNWGVPSWSRTSTLRVVTKKYINEWNNYNRVFYPELCVKDMAD